MKKVLQALKRVAVAATHGVRKVFRGPVKALAVAAAVVTVAGAVGLHVARAVAAESKNCDANAVVWCGATSPSALLKSYDHGDGHNSAASIQHIYGSSVFQITSSEITGMATTAVEGSVSKNGDVYINGGKTLVATGALTAGRENISGSKKHTSDGTTFYTRTPSVSFLQGSLTAMVVMKNGVFQFAILHSCGNPVTGKPKKPNYSIQKQVRAGTSGSYGSNVTVKSGDTVQYQITVSSTGAVPVVNVTVHDTLPAGITYTSGTLQENGSAVSSANASKFFGSGLLISSIANGSKDVFTFNAVAGPDNYADDSCKAALFTNTGFISAPGLSNQQGSAGVHTTCAPPVALTCVELTSVAGSIDAATGDQDYSFKAQSTASNATITGYDFTFGDGKTGTVSSGDTLVSTTHTYAPGSYTANVTVNATANGKTYTATSPQCSAPITVKQPVPSTLACVGLDLTPGTVADDGTTTYTLKATATQTNAHIATYAFTFGDGGTQAVAATGTSASVTHPYAPGATYTASVSVSGTDAAGNPLTAPVNPKCSGTITVKTPECKPGVPVGSPACNPSSLACVGLTGVPGDVDAATGSQLFTFTGKASATNATITTYTFDFGDGKSTPVSTSDTSATATHTYAPGTYTATLTVAGKDASGSPIQTAANGDCSKQITVKTPECKPGVPEGDSSCYVYTCNAFTLTLDNPTRTVTVASFDASSTNPKATLAHVTVDWGDGSTPLATDAKGPVGQTHAFTVDQATVIATAQFTVDGQDTPVSSTTCTQPVSFTELPPVLPNTGAGNVIGIVAGAVAAGTLGARLFLSRRVSRR